MSEIIEWSALGQVLAVGLLVGAGVPTLFALGLRLLTATPAVALATSGPGSRAGATAVMTAPPLPQRAAGYLCLAMCLAAILTGLAFLVSGGH